MKIKKILVVDDDSEVCEMLHGFLVDKGYHAMVAKSGEEAIEVYGREQPHVVLLDYRMPGMSGLDILRDLKTLDPNACIIMVTAVLDKGLYRLVMSEGASDHITKPLDLERLDIAIRTRITLHGISE